MTTALINVTINSSSVKVKKYEGVYKAAGIRKVCGSTAKLTYFNYLPATKIPTETSVLIE